MDVPHSSQISRPLTQWQDAADDEGVPWRMLCPVGHSIMYDPVVASDGNTYDRPALKRVLADVFNAHSPVTGEALNGVYLPNGALQREIAAFIAHNPHLDVPLEPAQAQALQMAVAQGVPPHIAKAALLNSSVLPYHSADVQLAHLLQDVGHRPPRLAAFQSASTAQGLQAPGAPPRRNARAGRLGAVEMARQPPAYGDVADTTLRDTPAAIIMQSSEVRLRYQMMPQTPTPMPASQLGTRLPATRIWNSPPGEGFYTPTTRGVAVGSLAGGTGATQVEELTDLTYQLFG